MIVIEKIDKEEALRYMGYKGQQLADNIKAIIDDAAETCLSLARPVYTYKVFDIECADDSVKIVGSDISFESHDLCKHLTGCKKCAIMCATIGAGFDMALKPMQITDPTKAVIFNSCGSALIEQVCDVAEEEILKSAQMERHNFRFSPGYGDLPMSAQQIIFRLVAPERQTGMTLSSSNLLIPTKSVTAFIGFSDTKKEIVFDKCSICRIRDTCPLRKGGNLCDHNAIH